MEGKDSVGIRHFKGPLDNSYHCERDVSSIVIHQQTARAEDGVQAFPREFSLSHLQPARIAFSFRAVHEKPRINFRMKPKVKRNGDLLQLRL